MLRGLTTVTCYVDDVAAAAAWYTELLGIEPYFAKPSFEEPAYVEFRIGVDQDELGLISSAYRPPAHSDARPAGAVTYWHVDDVAAAVTRFVDHGATELEPPTNRGEEGWVTASVVDPFGAIIGLMHSPHYLDLLSRRG